MIKKAAWKISILSDGLLALFFVSQFDVDDMIVQYVGALVCIVLFLFLLIIGWNWIMDGVNNK